MKRFLPWVLALAVGTPPQAVRSQEQGDPELRRGIQQAQEGDFNAAVITLDGVVRRLSENKGNPKELSRAYVYLAISYLGLSQEQAAKAKFLEAWRADREMNPSPSEFPPRILKMLDEAKSEAMAEAPPPDRAPPAAAPAAPSAPAATEPAKKGGSKAPLILVGVAAVGGGVALAAGGGGKGGSSPTAAATPAPTSSGCSAGQFRAISALWEQPNFTCPLGSTNPSAVIAVSVANDSAVTVNIISASSSNNVCTPDPGFTCTYNPRAGLNIAPLSVAARTQASIRVGDVLNCNNTNPNAHGRITFNADFTVQTSCGSVTVRPSNVFTLVF